MPLKNNTYSITSTLDPRWNESGNLDEDPESFGKLFEDKKATFGELPKDLRYSDSRIEALTIRSSRGESLELKDILEVLIYQDNLRKAETQEPKSFGAKCRAFLSY